MKKAQEEGLTLMISLILLIIIISQYFIFFVFFPNKTISPYSKEYIGSEIDYDIITFVKLNSNLIVKSVKDNNYNEIEKEINKLKFDECFELKINEKVFNNNCNIKNPETTMMTIPNYNNNQIKITLNVNKK